MAGFVKGVVGFAMPMIFVSGLSSFLAPELALAMLMLPTLATNGIQALRQGPRAAWESIARFKVYMIVGGVVLILSAQLVNVLPMQVMLLIIGVPVTGFALMQIVGWTLTMSGQSTTFEVVIGVVAGFLGGISGIWGPPTVMYLTALGTQKHDQMRAQGVIYAAECGDDRAVADRDVLRSSDHGPDRPGGVPTRDAVRAACGRAEPDAPRIGGVTLRPIWRPCGRTRLR